MEVGVSWSRGRREVSLWLLFCAALICARMPNVLAGRFWAEDGSIFYARAWVMPWWKALFAPYAGYLNLVGNMSGVIARNVLSIEAAPFASLFISLIIQLLPCAVIVTCFEGWLRSRAVLALALGLVILRPITEEVWLNVANSQVHLLLSAALILVLSGHGWWRALVMLLAPLSGPGPAALVPLAIIRCWREPRDRSRWWEGMCLLLGLGLQAIFVIQLPQIRPIHWNIWPFVAGVYVKNLLVPLLGSAALPRADVIHAVVERGRLPLRALFSVLIAAGLLGSLVAQCAANRPRQLVPLWLATAGMLTLILSYFGAGEGPTSLSNAVGGARYAFTPQSLFLLAVLAAGVWSRNMVRLGCSASLLWVLGVGLSSYFRPVVPLFSAGPNWRAQVAEWRMLPTHRLAIWPPGWFVVLYRSQKQP